MIATLAERTVVIDPAVEGAIEKYQRQTTEHRSEVYKIIHWFAERLVWRGISHDRSKLQSPELEGFALQGTELANLEYGSGEYRRNLLRLKETVKHHYALNRHHPEHFENGVSGMNLIDVVEMFCDWLAATKLNKNGDIYRSIEVGAERFHLDPQLKQILINTAREFEKSSHP